MRPPRRSARSLGRRIEPLPWQAAIALKTLVLANEANQHAIAHGLVRMLTAGTAEAQEQVTELVRDLCLDLETAATISFNENRSAIARAGGIPQLVRQLKSGTERAQSLGAEALSLLALRSGDLRVQARSWRSHEVRGCTA